MRQAVLSRLHGMPTAFDVRALTSTVRIELDDTLSSEERASIRSTWTDLIDSGDFNKDGKTDIIVREGATKTLKLYLNNGVKQNSIRGSACIAR